MINNVAVSELFFVRSSVSCCTHSLSLINKIFPAFQNNNVAVGTSEGGRKWGKVQVNLVRFLPAPLNSQPFNTGITFLVAGFIYFYFELVGYE